MNNPNHDNTAETSTVEDEHWGQRLIDHINTWWMDRRPTGPALRQALRIPPKHATALILTTIAGLIAMTATLAWWLVTSIVNLAIGIATGIRDTATDRGAAGTHHLAAWSMTRTITAPVHRYLDEHAAGLPVAPHTLWVVWLATTLGLFILAVLGSRGARIGWVINGATTAAMVYAGTPSHGQALAAGLAVTGWAALSVPAFNRLMPAAPTLHLSIPPRKPRAETD